MNKEIGRFCFYFRKEVLNLTLKQFSDIINMNMKTISSFENGNSSNYQILLKYYLIADSIDREQFLEDFSSLMERIEKHGKNN